MEFVPFLVLAVLVKKAIDWLRVLIPDDIESRVLIPASWIVGVAVAFLFASSELLAGDIVIWGEHTLADADWALVLVYGWAVGASAGVIHDLAKPNTPPHDADA